MDDARGGRAAPAVRRGARPLIGVTGPEGRGWGLWAAAAFSLALHGARARRITPPFAKHDVAGLDGLLIGGGDDVGADLYGGEVRANVRLDPERDALELAALEAFWDSGRPVLGICRGSQIMNVFRGGTLHRDVRESFGLDRYPRTPLPLKTVRVEAGTRLAAALRMETVKVNALHLQAVERLGEGLRAAAHDRHGMVQAVEATGAAFRVGVQWHPELLFYRTAHRRLFGAFVGAVLA
jgi:putative glutamine amidotransferase